MQPITSSPGIYFDYLGKLKIHNGNLNVVIPLDISYIGPHIENVNSVLGTVRYLCKQSKALDDIDCHNILEPLTVRYHDIVKEYSSISHLMNNRAKRSAWFGGVGTVFKHIFGTLDEDDALKYDDAISSVQNNQKELASLMKQNILVTTSTIASYNKTLYKIKFNEDSLTNAVDKFSLELKNLSVISNDLLIKSKLNYILNSLETTILSLSFQLEAITNSVLFTNQNILHPTVITPLQLYRELADSYRHLPNDLELPVKLDIDLIHVILSSSKLVCYFLNNKIIFVLQIPLVASKEYSLFHSVALPVPHGTVSPNSFTTIVPSIKYIAMTKDKSQYCKLDDLNQCKIIDSRYRICEITDVFPSGTNPSCESELMSKVINKLPVQCETKFIYGIIDTWKPLANNRWIYVQSQLSKLSIDCNNLELFETNILGTGILNIPSNCTAYCKSARLLPKYKNLNVSIPLYKTDFNLINDSCCSVNKFNNIAPSVTPLKLQNLDLDKININPTLILDSMSQKVNKILTQQHVIKYGAHYSVIVIIIVIVLLCIVIFKLYSMLKSGSSCLFKTRTNNPVNVAIPKPDLELDNQPTPAPRLRSGI